MGKNGNGKDGRIDWEAIERDVLTTPGMTLTECSEKWGVAYKTMKRHGGTSTGNWINRRNIKMREMAQERDTRLTEILAQDRADDVTALSEIQFRMQRAAVSFMEMLFPPADAPIEAHEAAGNRLAGMSGKQIAESAATFARSLAETGRHIRLLTGRSTAIFARADSPDVYIPDSLEVARALEMQSRLAQRALKAAANCEAIDIEGCIIPPISAVPPKSLSAQSTDGCPDDATNEDGPEVGI